MGNPSATVVSVKLCSSYHNDACLSINTTNGSRVYTCSPGIDQLYLVSGFSDPVLQLLWPKHGLVILTETALSLWRSPEGFLNEWHCCCCYKHHGNAIVADYLKSENFVVCLAVRFAILVIKVGHHYVEGEKAVFKKIELPRVFYSYACQLLFKSMQEIYFVTFNTEKPTFNNFYSKIVIFGHSNGQMQMSRVAENPNSKFVNARLFWKEYEISLVTISTDDISTKITLLRRSSQRDSWTVFHSVIVDSNLQANILTTNQRKLVVLYDGGLRFTVFNIETFSLRKMEFNNSVAASLTENGDLILMDESYKVRKYEICSTTSPRDSVYIVKKVLEKCSELLSNSSEGGRVIVEKYDEIRPLLVWTTHLTSLLLMQMYMHSVGLGEGGMFPADVGFLSTLRSCLVYVKNWQTQHSFQPSLLHNSDWAERCGNLLSSMITSLANNSIMSLEDLISDLEISEDLMNLLQISRIPSFRPSNSSKNADSNVILSNRRGESIDESQEDGKTRSYKKCSCCDLTSEIKRSCFLGLFNAEFRCPCGGAWLKKFIEP